MIFSSSTGILDFKKGDLVVTKSPKNTKVYKIKEISSSNYTPRHFASLEEVFDTSPIIVKKKKPTPLRATVDLELLIAVDENLINSWKDNLDELKKLL